MQPLRQEGQVVPLRAAQLIPMAMPVRTAQGRAAETADQLHRVAMAVLVELVELLELMECNPVVVVVERGKA